MLTASFRRAKHSNAQPYSVEDAYAQVLQIEEAIEGFFDHLSHIEDDETQDMLTYLCRRVNEDKDLARIRQEVGIEYYHHQARRSVVSESDAYLRQIERDYAKKAVPA